MTLAASLAAQAQINGDNEWNHFGADLRVGFNIKAKFSNIGASSQTAPPLSGAVDHNYADGFVRVDSSGNRGGLTWNWGYQNASQIVNDTLQLHLPSAQGASSTASDDPRYGFEASYARDLSHFGGGRWGIKVALGFTDIKIRDTQPLNGAISLMTDAYQLGGITPPQAPYSGSFAGPGPVIADSPTRTISMVAGAAQITGSRQMEAWLYDLRFGPYIDLTLVPHLSLQVSGGLAAGVVDSTFTFSDNTTTSAGTIQISGRDEKSDWLVGFYAEATLAYQIVPDTALFAGSQFQYLGEFNQNAGGRGAQLDLKQSIYFIVGVQLHF